ncbi:MAG TPA: DUF6624 domain-containing protein, partial [Emticicia sp.]
SLSFAQLNLSLKRELDSIYVLDQKYRELLNVVSKEESKADSLVKVYQVKREDLTSHLWRLQTQADTSNMIRVKKIVAQYGYPGKSMVGTPTNEAVFYVIQHSKEIDVYLPIVQKAAEEKELAFPLYAMMLDRSLMYQGKAQIYGTQGHGFEATNPETKKKGFKMVIWPIKDPESVNERRKAAGFTQTVEENARRLGIEYKVYTIEDIQQRRVY